MNGFEPFAAELRQRLLPGNANVLVLRQADSTNGLTRRVVSECTGAGLDPPRLWVFAWGQNAGKGRLGRTWVSPDGQGVYATVSLGSIGLDKLDFLPLVVAASLCTTVNTWLGGRCRLKWPNDLVVEGRKLGGILIESVSRGTESAAAIVGFGINHGQGIDEQRAANATSLARLGAGPATLAETAAALALRLDRDLELPAEVAVERYAALSAHRAGDLLRCQSAGETVEGRFAGFDRRGFLRLDTASGARLLAAGEVIES